MATKYCALCERNVEPKRNFGVGTLIFVIFTSGLGLLLLPLWEKRCPICKGSALSAPRSGSVHKLPEFRGPSRRFG